MLYSVKKGALLTVLERMNMEKAFHAYTDIHTHVHKNEVSLEMTENVTER